MRQAWIQGVYAELLFANDREIFESGKYWNWIIEF
jgi:hypothetical protein